MVASVNAAVRDVEDVYVMQVYPDRIP